MPHFPSQVLARRQAFLLALAVVPTLLFAQYPVTPDESPKADPTVVFATQGEAVLTQQELDAAFSAIPEPQRLTFIRDGARVDQLVAALLTRKLVAAAAEQSRFEADPLVADRVRLAAQKELAETWLEHIVATAPEADYEALALEDYLVNRDSYRAETVLDVSQILVGIADRSPEDARRLATSLHVWLEKEPGRWDELVAEYSDDPAKSENAGRYSGVRRGQMVQPFERAAFALETPGEISKPTRSPHGYHIIRLNARSGGEIAPFEDVREAAIERVRIAYLEGYRDRYLRSLRSDPIVIPDGAVEIMARRHFGEDLEMAPDFNRPDAGAQPNL